MCSRSVGGVGSPIIFNLQIANAVKMSIVLLVLPHQPLQRRSPQELVSALFIIHEAQLEQPYIQYVCVRERERYFP